MALRARTAHAYAPVKQSTDRRAPGPRLSSGSNSGRGEEKIEVGRKLSNPPPRSSSEFFAGPEMTGSGPESNDYSNQRAQLGETETDIGNLGARTAKNLVEDDEQFMQHRMAAAFCPE